MDSSGEISLLCRLCLVKEQVNVPIFGENGDIRQIFLKISSCLPVKVSKEDPLPKNICEGCSDKLDSLYTFWNTSRDAEKTLLSWLQQAQVDNADEAVSAISKQISAQSELVKEETELTQDVSIKEDNDETGAPPAKRARRTAAVKAQISISQEESEEEDDVDEVEPLTKVEDESDMSDNDGTDDQPLSTFVDMPGTSVDEEQAGPSGVGKEAADAPPPKTKKPSGNKIDTFYCNKCGKNCGSFSKLHEHMRTSPHHNYSCPSCNMDLGTSLVQVVLHTRKFCSREKFMQAESKLVQKHPGSVRYYCERCQKGLPALSNLLKHYLEEHRGQILCCSECDKTSSNFLELSHHFRDHVQDNTGPGATKEASIVASKNNTKAGQGAPKAPTASKDNGKNGSGAPKTSVSSKDIAKAGSGDPKTSNLSKGKAKGDSGAPKTSNSSKDNAKAGSAAFKTTISSKDNAKNGPGTPKASTEPPSKASASVASKPGAPKSTAPASATSKSDGKANSGAPKSTTSTPRQASTPTSSKDNTKTGPGGSISKSLGAPTPTKSLYSATSKSTAGKAQTVYCNKCGQAFPDFTRLHQHIFQAEDHEFQCAHCEFKVGHTLVNLMLHTKRFCSRDEFRQSEEKLVQAKPGLTRYFCERCGKGLGTLTEFFRHHLEHKNEFLWCSECDKKASTFMELLVHFREHTVDGNVQLKCQMCPLEFFAVEPMKLHYFVVHSRVSGIPYECDLCVRVFADDDEKFLFHIQAHSQIQDEAKPGRPRHDVSKLTCEFCAQICDSVEKCKVHRAQAHGITADSQRDCPICNEKILVSSLSSHLVKHQREKASKVGKLSKFIQVQGDMEENDDEEDEEQEEREEEAMEIHDSEEGKQERKEAPKRNEREEEVMETWDSKKEKYERNEAPKRKEREEEVMQMQDSKQKQERREAPRRKEDLKWNEARTPTRTLLPTPVHQARPPATFQVQQPPPKLFTPGPSLGGLTFSQPKCEECGRTFFSMFALNEHLKSHLMDKAFSTMSPTNTYPSSAPTNTWNKRTPETFQCLQPASNFNSLYATPQVAPPAPLFERRSRGEGANARFPRGSGHSRGSYSGSEPPPYKRRY